MMQKYKKPLALVLALAVVLMLVNALGRFLGIYTLRFVLLGACAVLLPLLFYLPRKGRRALATLLGITLLLSGGALFGLYAYSGTLSYLPAANSFLDGDVLSSKKVLVFVPHQDDETNLAYAAISAYKDAGSSVSIAYLTNGDYFGNGQTRMREAVRAAAVYGIAAQNVYFLGYGDRWQGTHLYNSQPDALCVSADGRTSTYGAQGIPDFRTRMTGEPADYTRANALADVQSLLDLLRPDVIFAVDCDAHADHRACSLLFEEALGQFIHTDASYRPVVYKGYAYDTAWEAEADLYEGDTLLRTAYPLNDVLPYEWTQRLRFPIPQTLRAYTVRASALEPILREHASQNAILKGASILNGDEVFFERRTDNLALLAQVEADAPGARVLWDFKLRDTGDVNAKETVWDAGVFNGTQLRFSWDAPVDIASLVLCDAPDQAQNTGAVTLRALTETGEVSRVLDAPDPYGRRSAYTLGLTGVTQLELALTAGQDGAPALCEIELLPPREEPTTLLKITDEEGNFAYQLMPRAGEEILLGVYSAPGALPQAVEAVLTDAQGNAVDAVHVEGTSIRLDALPAGMYTLRAQCGALYDETVLLVNKDMTLIRLSQRLEAFITRVRERLAQMQE